VSAPLSRRVLASYSAITLPLAAMSMPIAVYMPPFYGQGLGLSLTVVGGIFTLARIWDVVTDPIMGAVVDRYETRWGRRKHWIAIAVPILLLSIWHVFLPDPDAVDTVYLASWLLILYVGYTMAAIAHQSWGAELTTTYDERSRLFGWREIFVIAGMTLVLSLPAFVEFFGDGAIATKVASMGIFCLVLLPLTTIPLLRWVPDRRAVRQSTVDWKAALRLLVGNRPLWRVLVADLTTGFGSTANGSLYIFFATWVFGLPQHASFALLLYFLSGFLAMPLWLKLAYAVGKDRAIRIALLYGITLKVLLFFFAEAGNVPLFWTYTFLYGAAFGAAPTLLRSMMADLTDVDELETGRKRAGLFFALLTTTNKLGSALAVGVVLTVVELGFGFSPSGENSQAAVDGLLLVYCTAPIIAMTIAFLPLLGYPIDRAAHAKVRAKLDARAAAA
jgi:Na+/melibiose symporter-like transporter